MGLSHGALGAASPREHSISASLVDSLFQGWLDVYDSSRYVRHWRRRWVVLMPDQLAIYKVGLDDPIASIMLAGSAVSLVCLVSKRSYSFRVMGANGTVHRFAAESQDERQAWTTQIRRRSKVALTFSSSAIHKAHQAPGCGSDSAETFEGTSGEESPWARTTTSDFLSDAIESADKGDAEGLTALIAHLNGSEVLSELEKTALEDTDPNFRKVAVAGLSRHMADHSTAPRAAAVVALALVLDSDAEVRQCAALALTDAGADVAPAVAGVLREVAHVAADEETQGRASELLKIVGKVQELSVVTSPRLTAQALEKLQHDLVSDIAAHHRSSVVSSTGFGVFMNDWKSHSDTCHVSDVATVTSRQELAALPQFSGASHFVIGSTASSDLLGQARHQEISEGSEPEVLEANDLPEALGFAFRTDSNTKVRSAATAEQMPRFASVADRDLGVQRGDLHSLTTPKALLALDYEILD